MSISYTIFFKMHIFRKSQEMTFRFFFVRVKEGCAKILKLSFKIQPGGNSLAGRQSKNQNPIENTLLIRKTLIEIALGEKAADQYIKGGQVLNVYTGELLKENIAVYDDRIAYVGPSEKMIGKKTRVWEAQGKILVPGYMDPHAHTDLFYNPAAFSEQVVQTGTTSVFSDMHDLANALGLSGIQAGFKGCPALSDNFLCGGALILPAIPPV